MKFRRNNWFAFLQECYNLLLEAEHQMTELLSRLASPNLCSDLGQLQQVPWNCDQLVLVAL